CAELSETVGCKEDLFAGLISHHDLRPVHHGRHDKVESMFAQRQGVPFLHTAAAAAHVFHGEELGQHGNGLHAGNQFHVGIFFGQHLYAACVVRLHVGDDQIIRLSAVQHSFQIGQPSSSCPLVHCIHHGDFLIENHIGVIGNAVGNLILSFKQVNGLVVHTDIADSLRNGYVFHKNIFSFTVL